MKDFNKHEPAIKQNSDFIITEENLKENDSAELEDKTKSKN